MINLEMMSAAEAAEELRAMGMRTSADTVRIGIEQGCFPFGDLIRTKDGNPICYIYRKKLMEWAEDKGYILTSGEVAGHD